MRERASSGAAIVVAAWWTYVAIDFVIHAALLESWWQSTAAFWLPPVELAKRLPFAYAGLALYCVSLCWLMVRIRIGLPRVADGLRVGAACGAVFGSVAALVFQGAELRPGNKDLTFLDGGWAVVWRSFTASVVESPGGEAKQIRGTVLAVLKQLPDGSWKVFRAMGDTSQ